MKLRSSAFAALLALAVVSCGDDRRPPTGPVIPPVVNPPVIDPPPIVIPPTLAVTKFMAFGDSLTGGSPPDQLVRTTHDHGTPGGPNSYPALLYATLVATYTGQADTIQVFNAGVGGEMVVGSGAKDRLIAELAVHQPDVLLLLHGVNNLNEPTSPIGPIAESIDELIEVAHARKPGIHVFLANLPPQSTALEATRGPRIAAFNDQLRLVAAEEGATLVDIHSGIDRATMLDHDGLHLNKTGNIKLAELFYAAIKAKYHQAPPQ